MGNGFSTNQVNERDSVSNFEGVKDIDALKDCVFGNVLFALSTRFDGDVEFKSAVECMKGELPIANGNNLYKAGNNYYGSMNDDVHNQAIKNYVNDCILSDPAKVKEFIDLLQDNIMDVFPYDEESEEEEEEEAESEAEDTSSEHDLVEKKDYDEVIEEIVSSN